MEANGGFRCLFRRFTRSAVAGLILAVSPHGVAVGLQSFNPSRYTGFASVTDGCTAGLRGPPRSPGGSRFGACGSQGGPCYVAGVNSESSLNATLLVAMPQLQDPNFHRTVMLIVEHDENGTFGLVLNRQVDLLASTLCASLDVRWSGDPEANIQWGGPVEPNSGWLLFSEPLSSEADNPAVTQVGGEGIFLARSLDVLRDVASTPEAQIRFFLGYAGWGPGQLEGEMAQGAWLVAPADPDLVFDADFDFMWERAVRSMGIDPATLIPTQGIH